MTDPRPIGTEFIERYHPVNPTAPRIDVRWRVIGLMMPMSELLEAVAVMIVPTTRPTYPPEMETKGEK